VHHEIKLSLGFNVSYVSHDQLNRGFLNIDVNDVFGSFLCAF